VPGLRRAGGNEADLCRAASLKRKAYSATFCQTLNLLEWGPHVCCLRCGRVLIPFDPRDKKMLTLGRHTDAGQDPCTVPHRAGQVLGRQRVFTSKGTKRTRPSLFRNGQQRPNHVESHDGRNLHIIARCNSYQWLASIINNTIFI
jgi:hypothetical protein